MGTAEHDAEPGRGVDGEQRVVVAVRGESDLLPGAHVRAGAARGGSASMTATRARLDPSRQTQARLSGHCQYN